MGLTVKESSGGDYTPVSQGLHHAVCYSIFDLGTQFNEYFGKKQHKLLLCWELPDERIQIEKDGEQQDLPRAVSKEYTASLNEKSNLRKDLETWRGKAFSKDELEGFDIKVLLGVNCNIQVIHKTKGDKTYSNVSAVMPMMKGVEKREAENPLRFFSFEDGGDIPEGTPEWIEKKILAAEEASKHKAYEPEQPPYSEESSYPVDGDDDIPF